MSNNLFIYAKCAYLLYYSTLLLLFPTRKLNLFIKVVCTNFICFSFSRIANTASYPQPQIDLYGTTLYNCIIHGTTKEAT